MSRAALEVLPLLDVPFVQIRREWLRALVLFGRCSPTEWEILMTVADLCYGLPKREAVELGGRVLRESCPSTDAATLERAMRRLTRPAGDGDGFGLLSVVSEPTATAARVVRLQEDWERWAWLSPADRSRARTALLAARPDAPPAASEAPPSDDARDLAKLLREHCARTVPGAVVPPEDIGNRSWLRWCRAMDRLLEKHARGVVAKVIRFLHHNEFWSDKILGESADKRFARNFDQLYAQAAKAARRSPA